MSQLNEMKKLLTIMEYDEDVGDPTEEALLRAFHKACQIIGTRNFEAVAGDIEENASPREIKNVLKVLQKIARSV